MDKSAAKERLERAWGDIYEQDAKEDALGKPVPAESLLDEDDFAVIREEQASSVAQDRFAEWYGSTRYDWFMLGILLGAGLASLVWWVFA